MRRPFFLPLFAALLALIGAGCKHKTSANTGDPTQVVIKSLDGKDVTVAQYKGKVVLVNFWATWCEPCKIEIPELIQLQTKYEPKGFTILGVAMDDDGKSVVGPFVQTKRYDIGGSGEVPMNYPILIGSEDIANKFGGLLGYPTTVLFDKDGKEIKRTTGAIAYDEYAKVIEGSL
ncbi:MAG TPA: TlpA disulfide reductase family protein [Candidatus Acidoferrum sp.]|nr:TlpA disulfide reductase family protein [Candidatus Acidoferrum sp.]